MAAPATSPESSLIGAYVSKPPSPPPPASKRGGGAVLGKIASVSNGIFRIVYENGEYEGVGLDQARAMMLGDNFSASGMKMSTRKRKLDQLAPTPDSAANSTPVSVARVTRSRARKKRSPTPPPVSESSDPSEGEESEVEVVPMVEETVLPEMPELPESSGDIGVPEQSVPYLFSVYNFVRSFSLPLYLSPFSLEDFVGALNCKEQNALMDAVHFALMVVLKRHLEMVVGEDNKKAEKCLSVYDWALLDLLTWPAFLVEYLYIMGYMKKIDEGEFNKFVRGGEYFALPAAIKLKILQILCDEIVESAELREELALRENMEEEKEGNVDDVVALESTPMWLNTKSSKALAQKDSEPVLTPEPSKLSTAVKVVNADKVATDSVPDGNRDDCCLCGMDGKLVCCDGCPSAYHRRCIGLTKALTPVGTWFCPECSVSKLGPTASRIGRGVKGAEIFGIDPYGRMFLGTCNYLLVIRTSVNLESICGYYSQDDVSNVLSILCSKGESIPTYVGICREISKYWELPLIDAPTDKIESITHPQSDKDLAVESVRPSVVAVKGSIGSVNDVKGETHLNNITEGSADNREILSRSNAHVGLKVEVSALDVAGQATLQYSENNDTSHDTSTKNIPEHADGTPFPQKDDQAVSLDANKIVQQVVPLLQNRSIDHTGSGSVLSNFSNVSPPISAEGSTVVDFAANASGVCREDAGSVFSKKIGSLSVSAESNKMHYQVEKFRASEKNPTAPSSFKPQAYVNQYIFGNIAASAAANLALLAAEDSSALKAQDRSSSRIVNRATSALQKKAFAETTLPFFWPSYEKKLMEGPKERCGWCFGCKCSYKSQCLLNVAAANAIKVSGRNATGLHTIKYNGSHLPSIAAHIGNMEERLHGLLTGPFLDAGYTQQWRKQAREARSFRMVKFLLLELEKNTREVVFSVDWIKPVDDWAMESSTIPTSVNRSRLNSKRGTKRNKKQTLASEFLRTSQHDRENEVQWWRGGKLAKTVYQKAALPSSLAKKAARQGGRKRVPGIIYPDGSELPRRSRQFAWRSSVDMSKNASELAFQVRFLDAHIRWRDLVRSDQSSSEGKGLDIDTVFRNAVICDKRIAEDSIAYALIFANQKHLPLRVMKSILEIENEGDENGKLWFYETHIPLYLIKEYEQKNSMPSVLTSSPNLLTSWRELKTQRRNVLLYLVIKRDNPSKGPCSSCQGDLLLRDAIRCRTCQGFCHKSCTIPSTLQTEDDLGSLFPCKLCYAKSVRLANFHKEVSNSQMPLQMQNQHTAGIKCRLKVGVPQAAHVVADGLRLVPSTVNNPSGRQPPSQGQRQQYAPKLLSMKPKFQVGPHQTVQVQKNEVYPHQTAQVYTNVHPEMSSSVSDCDSKGKAKHGRKVKLSFGLIWKKPNDSELGKSFRLKNIVLKCKTGSQPSKRPTCILCKMSYHSDLMYIGCEFCPNWFHADAFKLEEAQIFDLIGFKCPKCRKIGSPECPYSNNYSKRQKIEQLGHETEDQFISKNPKVASPATWVPQQKLEDVSKVDNYRHNSFSEFEPFKGRARMENQTNRASSVSQWQQRFPKVAEAPPASNIEMDDLVIADPDPLLPIGRVEPIEPVVEFHVQPNGNGAASQGHQKLSVRRAQVKHEMSDDLYYLTEDAYSRSPSFSHNLQNLPVSGNDNIISDARDFSVMEDANILGATNNAQDGWDNFDMYGYTDGDVDFSEFKEEQLGPGDLKFEDVEYEPQSNKPCDQSDVNLEYTGFEPQTYFSYTELLASEDEGFDNQYDVPGNMSGLSHGAMYPDIPHSTSGAYTSSPTAHGTGFDGVACEKCKKNIPSPDLSCEICGMCIHFHCSPWVESREPSGGTQWRCGSCKEWR